MNTVHWRRGAFSGGVVALLAAASVLTGSVAHAADPQSPGSTPSQSTSYGRVDASFSLAVSPTRLSIAPADIGKSHTFEVINRGQSPLAVTVQKRNFVGGADGTLVFQKHARYSASNWVTIHPASFVLAPGTEQIVTATVTVPAGPEPGDHEVALVFLVPAARTNANIKINRGIGTPVYITVPGATDNTVSVRKLTASGFVTGGRVAVTATLHNTGDVHRDFRAPDALAIHAAGSAAAFPDFTVIRGSTRVISTSWNPPPACICHVRVTVQNADGTQSSASVRVIVIPLKLVGGLLLLALLLGLAIRIGRRRYRAHVSVAAAKLHAGAGD
ncbi:MAG: hypothetical protein JWR35_1977 [Marmoricola sp.]|nr:hypothetical protein [Marmoricola sp.]